jgi:hypothetical protein
MRPFAAYRRSTGIQPRERRRFLEVFPVRIRNKNTRIALPGCVPILRMGRAARIGEVADIEPIHVGAHIEGLQATAAKPTVKQ